MKRAGASLPSCARAFATSAELETGVEMGTWKTTKPLRTGLGEWAEAPRRGGAESACLIEIPRGCARLLAAGHDISVMHRKAGHDLGERVAPEARVPERAGVLPALCDGFYNQNRALSTTQRCTPCPHLWLPEQPVTSVRSLPRNCFPEAPRSKPPSVTRSAAPNCEVPEPSSPPAPSTMPASCVGRSPALPASSR